MYIPLEEGEVVIVKVHKHWWFIFLRVVVLALLLAAPFIAYVALAAADLIELASTGTAVFAALACLWALVGWIMFWQFWTLYYMDMWVVTNRRLIDIDYIGFFDRNIAILRLDKVQDLTVKVGDLFGNLLGYGTLVVQTAGSDKEFIVEQIAHPEILRDTISRVMGETTERLRMVQLQK